MTGDPDRLATVLSEKAVLITGGTGFLGKVLIEKILRVSPTVKRIYLLVRPKKGKEPKQRLDELFSSPLYDKLKAERGVKNLIEKCRVVAGDVTEIDLGISEEDRDEIIENVSVVYHCAATIRFDEPLKRAVLLNVRGTKFILDLAKKCKNMELFVHVSTAYCHLHEKVLEEKTYDPPANPTNIIKCVEWMDDDLVNSMTQKILGDLPNTYAFTKALAEGLVNECMDDLPVIICRPSIVIPVWREPLPGWTDNINGPTGLLIGAGKGVIRTMYCNSDGYADFVPVDVAVSGLFAATWNFLANGDKSRRIYHLTSSAEIKVSWDEIIRMGRSIVETKVPLNGVMWYPGGSMKRNRTHHLICMFFFHLIPAIVIDCLLFVLGYKPVLCRVQRRINKGFEIFEYYANNQWDFDSNNIQHVRSLLNPYEKDRYKMDGEGLDMLEYFEVSCLAARRYLLKETDDTLPAARRHMAIMYWVDKISKSVIVGLFVYFVGGFLLRTILPLGASLIGL